MNPRAPNETIDAILNVFAMTLRFIREAVEDVPETRMTEQPGTIVNHPAWTLAHLGAYAGLLLAMLDDPSVPSADAEMERFGFGSTPDADRAAYPAKSALLARFTDRHARLAAVVADKHAEYFPRLAPEKFRANAPTIGHVAVVLLTSHESYHLGQLMQWRRAAGIGAKK